MLIKMFQANPYPEHEDVCRIAKSIGTNEERIERLFYKMRSKRKKEEVIKRE